MVQDSMEISYADQTIIKPQRRPCKKQLWLWQKWQDYQKFTIDQVKVQRLKQINQFANSLLTQVSQSKQIDRFSCTLDTKGDPYGFLIVNEKQIKFQNSQGNCLLFIQMNLIQNIKPGVKMFVKIISIQTANGTINFKQFIDIQTVLNTIQQARNSSGAPTIIKSRNIVQITPQQLAIMEERKLKIKNELPKLQEFQLHQEFILNDITIDHVYELIYSQKQVTIKGKTQPSFFAYTMKKSGASNYAITKYDSIGPKFYTHQQGVNFTNCPNFSSRTINYDVKLPPVPFMPKYAQNRQQCKIFWVSNEQFQYFIHSLTSGPPKADTFFIQVLHKVQKIDKNVKISIYWRIHFTQDSYLKGTIKSGASEQTRKQIEATSSEIKKFCNASSAKISQGGKGTQEMIIQKQQEQKQNIINNQKNILERIIQKINSLFGQNNQNNKGEQKNKTSFILIILTVVLLLNLILMIFKD